MTAHRTLDQDRVKLLSNALLKAIADHYKAGPEGGDLVLEVLNALAFCTGLVLAGGGDQTSRDKARRFFDLALSQNLGSVLEEVAKHGYDIDRSDPRGAA